MLRTALLTRVGHYIFGSRAAGWRDSFTHAASADGVGSSRCSKQNNNLLSFIKWLISQHDSYEDSTPELATHVRSVLHGREHHGVMERETWASAIRSACHGHSIELREDDTEDSTGLLQHTL